MEEIWIKLEKFTKYTITFYSTNVISIQILCLKEIISYTGNLYFIVMYYYVVVLILKLYSQKL